jgi:DNA-binding MarR family transcriptional regulator
MAKKKDSLIEEAEKIKADLDELKKKKNVLDAKPAKKAAKKADAKPAKKAAKKTAKKADAKPAKKAAKKADATAKKAAKKADAKPAKKAAKKAEEKPVKVKKLTKKELEEAKRIEELTLEEELEEQLSDEEIENFQIEKVDMERLTNKVCDILAEKESDGMFQGELWKKLKLTNQIGSRLALKLERMGTITREKLLENNRWTYKLILKKTPISTQSIENAPCLVCPVEQKCSLEGEISPRNCQFIEDWVIAELKKPVKAK